MLFRHVLLSATTFCCSNHRSLDLWRTWYHKDRYVPVVGFHAPLLNNLKQGWVDSLNTFVSIYLFYAILSIYPDFSITAPCPLTRESLLFLVILTR